MVLSLRMQERQMKRLDSFARRLGKTASETAALLIDEGLRRSEFAHIEFRDSAAGRRACLQGSSLAVWEVIMVAKSYEMDMEKTAKHFGWASFRVQAAINYWKAFPEEIELAIQDNFSYDFQKLQAMLPQTTAFTPVEQAAPMVKEAQEYPRPKGLKRTRNKRN
jgi:hypothetical protein